jgi:hypothetical protein
MKSRLYSARTDIHISCDLWTSPNCLPILGFVGHYISEDGQLESATLALVDIKGEHSGENLARYCRGGDPQVHERRKTVTERQ